MWIRIALILSTIYSSLNAIDNDKSIIIIGAGLSGYSAARKLMENGYNDIIILEALDRIGGRVYSIPFSDGIIDSGAQWVHGQTNNTIYEMVSPHFTFGSTPVDLYYPLFLLSNGTFPNQTNYQTLYSLGFKVLNDINNLILPVGSLGNLFLTHYHRALSNPLYQNIEDEIKELIKEEMHKNVNGDFATASWFDISARLNGLTEFAEGDQYLTWKKQGFVTVFDFITKKSPNPSEYLDIFSKVQLHKKVTNIRYNIHNPSAKSIVTCSDGTSYLAKHVIFTPSLGVLKKFHRSLFTPALPLPKILAIRNIGFGNVAKFFLEFENRFWITPDEPFLQYSLMWLQEHKALLEATGRKWMLDIAGIYAVDHFPFLLQVFLAGGYTYDFEMASDDNILNDIMWMFEMFLPHLKPIQKPRAVHKTKWLTHESFFGSYSYPSMDQARSFFGIQHLAASISARNGMPVILFAGEATSSEFPSFAHGAVDSGFRAADEIINFYE